MDPDRLDSRTDPDALLLGELSGPTLRRLARTAHGLSEESIELLTRLGERLRKAEGALPDPLI